MNKKFYFLFFFIIIFFNFYCFTFAENISYDTDKISILEHTINKQQSQIDALTDKLNTMLQTINIKEHSSETKCVNCAEQNQIQLTETELDKNNSLKIVDTIADKTKFYGYFDFRFWNYKFKNSNTLISMIYPGKTSFSNTNFNLYFDANISDRIKFLSEISLGYGLEMENSFYSSITNTDSNMLPPNTALLELHESKYDNKFDVKQIWVDYSHNNFFKIKLGKYPVPYGFYNVDHSPAVLIPSRIPILIDFELFPKTLTGIQTFGSILPGDFILNYYLMFGNGRSQISSKRDTNNFKAVSFGFDCQMEFDNKIFEAVRAGAFMYIDKTDQINKYMLISISNDSPFDIPSRILDSNLNTVKEKNFAVYLGIENKYFFIKSEYIEANPEFKNNLYLIDINPYTNWAKEKYNINPCIYGIYALTGYKYNSNLTFYHMFEYYKSDYSNDSLKGNLLGLNYRFSTYLIIKAEVGKMKLFDYPEGSFKSFSLSVSAVF